MCCWITSTGKPTTKLCGKWIKQEHHITLKRLLHWRQWINTGRIHDHSSRPIRQNSRKQGQLRVSRWATVKLASISWTSVQSTTPRRFRDISVTSASPSDKATSNLTHNTLISVETCAWFNILSIWLKDGVALHDETSELRDLPYGLHTVLSATRRKWMRHTRKPTRHAGNWFTYPGGMEGLSWPRWLATYRDGLPTRRWSPNQVLTVPDIKQLHWSIPMRYR